MRIRERRTLSDGGSETVDEKSSSDLWGVGLGADFSLPVARHVTATGRLAARWARGDRNAWISVEDSEGSESHVKLSDATDRAMFGAEIGVRWRPLQWLAVEGGWWHRDWSLDGGPASYDGPFVRASVGF
jgi:hypothetical protein